MWEAESLLQSLRAHRSDVTSLDMRGGTDLVTASSDKTVRTWKWRSGLGFVESEHSPARGHKYGVVCVRYSPQGGMVASCGIDGTSRVWGARRLRAVRVLLQPGGAAVRALCWAGGARLATGADDGSLCLWDVPRGHLLRVLSAHEGSLQAVSLCCEGSLLMTACTCGVLKLYVANELYDEEEKVSPVAWRDDAHDLGVLCADALETGEEVAADGEEEEGEAGEERAMALLGTGGQDGRVRVWRVVRTKGEAKGAGAVRLLARAALEGHTSAVTCVRWACGGTGARLASASLDRSVRLWAAVARPALCLRVLDAHQRYVNALVFSPYMDIMVTGSNDRTARVWSLREGVDVNTTFESACSVLSHFGVGDLEGIGPVGGEADTAELELSENEARRVWSDREIHGGAINGIAWRGDVVATACSDRVVRVFRLVTDDAGGAALRPERALEAHRYPVTAVDLTRDGAALLSAGLDGQAVLWDVESGRRLRGVSAEAAGASAGAGGGGARDARVSPRADPLLLVGSDDCVAPLWRLADDTQEPLHVYAGHGDAVTCCAWSADARLAVTGGAGGELRVHAAPPGPRTLLHVDGAHDLGVQSCDFASSASALGAVDEVGLHLLATAGCDSLAKLWAVRLYEDEAGEPRASARSVRRLVGHGGTVTCCRFSACGELLATSATDKHVRVWSSTSGRCLWATALAAGAASCALPAGAGLRLLVAGALDGELSLWRLPPPTMEKECNVGDLLVASDAETEEGAWCGGEARHWGERHVVRWLEDVARAPGDGIGAEVEARLVSRVRELHIDGPRLLDAPIAELLADFGFPATSESEAEAAGDDEAEVRGEGGEGARAVLRDELRWLRARPALLRRLLEVGEEWPHRLLCPITHRPMLEPASCADGFTYERAAAAEWFLAAGAAVSPLTGRALRNARLAPNYAVRRAVRRLLCARAARHDRPDDVC